MAILGHTTFQLNVEVVAFLRGFNYAYRELFHFFCPHSCHNPFHIFVLVKGSYFSFFSLTPICSHWNTSANGCRSFASSFIHYCCTIHVNKSNKYQHGVECLHVHICVSSSNYLKGIFQYLLMAESMPSCIQMVHSWVTKI